MTKVLPADVAKEIRALAFPWLACLAVIVLASSRVPLLNGFEVAAYFLGLATLGGLSMGHEYSNRTLPILLAQPIRRERLFVVKWGVLGVMMVTLAVITFVTNPDHRELSDGRFLWLPVLCCFSVAPWLTMWSRNPLAGTILCGGLPGTVFVAIQWIHFWITGRSLDENVLFPRVAVAVSIAGAVMAWRTFMRLEAIDGSGRHLQLPAWPSAGSETVTRRNPIGLLIRKELGLQQVSLALGGVMIVGWMIAMSLRTHVANITEMFYVLTLAAALPNAVIIGAVAGAEERQLGTHEWQLLLPMPASRQWLVKVVVAMLLTLVLCVLLPSPLVYSMGGADGFPLLRLSIVLGAAVVAAMGLYFSSLSTSGLRAVVLAVAAIGLGLIPGARLASMRNVARYANSVVGRSLDYYGYYALSPNAQTVVLRGVQFVLAAGFIFILLRFGLTNYRSAAPVGRHVWWQGLVIGLCLSTAAFILSVGSIFGMI